jgi:type IV pilus assembly protein PilC
MADFLILDDDKKVDSVNDVIEESINKSSEASLMDKLNAFLFSVQRIKTKDKVIFYRLLSTMINAGVSLLKAVSILEKQERNPILKKVLTEFTRELKE